MANSQTGQTPDARSGEMSDILKSIQGDIQVLVRGEVELAKQELTPTAKNAGLGAGVFVGALFFVLNALILLFIGGSLAIRGWLGLPIALGFVIMAGVLLVIAGVFALIGIIRFRMIKPPERTKAGAQQAVDEIKGAIARGTAAASGKELPTGSSTALPVSADNRDRTPVRS